MPAKAKAEKKPKKQEEPPKEEPAPAGGSEDVKLQSIATSAKKELVEIQAEFEEILKKENESNKGGWGPDILRKRAITKLRNRYKRESMVRKMRCIGKILGMTRIRNNNSGLLSKVAKRFEKTGENKYIKTKKQQDAHNKVQIVPDVDEEGNVQYIDYRQKIKTKDGRQFNNKQYNQVIKPNYAQDVFGVFEVFEGEESMGILWGKIALSGTQCSFEIPGGVDIECNITMDKKKHKKHEDFYDMRLGTDPADAIHPITLDEPLPTPQELIGSVAPVSTIATVVKDFKDMVDKLGSFNACVNLQNVNVVQIFPPNDQTGNQKMVIDDETVTDGDYYFLEEDDAPVTEMSCIVPSYIKLNFDVDSTIDITGSLFQPSEKEFPILMVIGIHPVEIEPLPETSEEEHEESEEDEEEEAAPATGADPASDDKDDEDEDSEQEDKEEAPADEKAAPAKEPPVKKGDAEITLDDLK